MSAASKSPVKAKKSGCSISADLVCSHRNHSGNLSVERLTDCLTASRQDVKIGVRPARRRRGEVSLVE